jgi:hypothetical protein
MALFNEILAGRYNRLLTRLLSMKGQAPTPQISGDLSAEIALETDRPEWGYLKQEVRFAGRQIIAGGAGIHSTIRARLTAKNVICVLESIVVDPALAAAADEYTLWVGGSAYTTDFVDAGAFACSRADSRWDIIPGSSWAGGNLGVPLMISGRNSVGATEGRMIGSKTAPLNTSVELLDRPIVLSSPDLLSWPIGCEVINSVNGQGFAVTFRGTIRAAEDSEMPSVGGGQ